MIDRLSDVAVSLIMLMEEETHYLRQHPFGAGLPELAATKLRLIGQLEQIAASIAREGGQWLATLDEEQKERLAGFFRTLERKTEENGAALKRQIDLSVELIGAIAAEAKRQAGRSTATYGAGGTMALFDPTMPIAVNSQY